MSDHFQSFQRDIGSCNNLKFKTKSYLNVRVELQSVFDLVVVKFTQITSKNNEVILSHKKDYVDLTFFPL